MISLLERPLLFLASFISFQHASLSIEECAVRIIAALERVDEAELEELACSHPPDPWLVGDHLLRKGHLQAALAFGDRTPDAVRDSLRAYLQSADPADSPGTLTRLQVDCREGAALRHSERPEESIALYERVERDAQGLGWLACESEALRGLGLSARLMPDGLDRAFEAWKKSAELDASIGNTPGEALSLFYLANACGETGRYEDSLAFFERAHSIFSSTGDKQSQIWALRGMGTAHGRAGRWMDALRCYEQADELVASVEDSQLRAQTLVALAEARGRTGDAKGAVQAGKEALQLYEQAGNRPGMGEARGTLGLAFQREGAFEEARDHHRKALDLFQEIKDVARATSALSNVALAEMHLGLLAQAEEHQREALAWAEDRGDRWQEAYANSHLSRILQRAKKYEESAECNERVLSLASLLESRGLEMQGHLDAARQLLDQELFDEAFRASLRAMAEATQGIFSLGLEESARWLDYHAEIFNVSLRAAFATGSAECLFWSLENSRARSLLQALGGAEHLSQIVTPPELEAERRGAVQRESRALQEYRSRISSGQDAEIERTHLSEAREDLRRVVERVRRISTGGIDLMLSEVASLEEVRSSLRTGEAMIWYALIEPRAVALVLTAAEARMVPLCESEEIVRACGQLRLSLGTSRGVSASGGKPGDLQQQGALLRKLVFVPLGLDDRVKRILVCPDGPLAFASFALIAPELEVACIPSGTTYCRLRAGARIRGDAVLAIGDPAADGEGLVPLPAAREEAAMVGDRTLLGEEATEEAFLEQAARREPWASIHFACHGLVDPENPLASELSLAPTESNDGRLTVLDVLGLSLRTQLVVLSACETGVGRIYRTEGVFGFPRAFFCAGARQVIVSLWRVDDAATHALMTRLYELWDPAHPQSMPLATALRQAQEYVSSQPKWAAPDYWAAWQLCGLPD